MSTDPAAVAEAAIVVFLGPSMPRAEAGRLLDATFRPPARQGDVCRAAMERPAAIALVDGFFNWVPSPWHKEVLWALSQGVHVFGASSMGALRAAELHPFGMVGVGRVFEDFRGGRLEDDDEVAVVHAGEEDGFRPLSDAMVNIRATLAAAVDAGVIGGSTERLLLDASKSACYPDRHLKVVVARSFGASRAADDDLRRLTDWLPGNAIDIKRRDCAELLRTLRAWAAAGPAPHRPGFTFQATANWSRLLALVSDGARAPGPRDVAVPDDTAAAVLEECRLDGSWTHLEPAALARLFVAGTGRAAHPATEDELTVELGSLCSLHGLTDADGLAAWLRETGWTGRRLEGALGRSALVRRARAYLQGDLEAEILALLALDGRLGPLRDRAAGKAAWLEGIGGPTSLVRADPGPAMAWFRAYIRAPEAWTDAVLAGRLGWRSVTDMADDVVREFLFRTSGNGAAPARALDPVAAGDR